MARFTKIVFAGTIAVLVGNAAAMLGMDWFSGSWSAKVWACFVALALADELSHRRHGAKGFPKIAWYVLRVLAVLGIIALGVFGAITIFFSVVTIFPLLSGHSPLFDMGVVPLAASLALGTIPRGTGKQPQSGKKRGILTLTACALAVLAVVMAERTVTPVRCGEAQGFTKRACYSFETHGQEYIAVIESTDPGPFRARMTVTLGKKFLIWQYAAKRVLYCSTLGVLPTPTITLGPPKNVVISNAGFCADIIHSGKDGNGSDFANGAPTYDEMDIKFLKD